MNSLSARTLWRPGHGACARILVLRVLRILTRARKLAVGPRALARGPEPQRPAAMRSRYSLFAGTDTRRGGRPAVDRCRVSQMRTLIVAAIVRWSALPRWRGRAWIPAGGDRLAGAGHRLVSRPSECGAVLRVDGYFRVARVRSPSVIRGTLPRPSRDVFLLGAAGFIVETAVQAWFWGGLALHPSILPPSSARSCSTWRASGGRS